MSEVRGSNSWPEELASLVDDNGIGYAGETIGIFPPWFETTSLEFVSGDSRTKESEETESLKDQVKGFAVAWGEILLECGRGCRDIAQQSLLTDDSYIVRKLRKPYAKVSGRLKFLNEFLPEDRHPAHAWSVIFFVFILAVAGRIQSTIGGRETRGATISLDTVSNCTPDSRHSSTKGTNAKPLGSLVTPLVLSNGIGVSIGDSGVTASPFISGVISDPTSPSDLGSTPFSFNSDEGAIVSSSDYGTT